jgi:choline dehydrogenase-like flavoprotein
VLIGITEAAARTWDVIVIGTGMGGGMAGRRLAERGLSVLLIEKGSTGARADTHALTDDIQDHDARLNRGFWPTQIETRIKGNETEKFFAPIGCGVGGSSVFYAAALERPERHDVETVEGIAHPAGGWPIRFDDLLPYIFQAEDLLSVRGGADPLSDLPGPQPIPTPLTEAEEALFAELESAGLHPYRSHEALRRLPGCAECLGRKCPRTCKMDGRSAGVEPALATGHAALLADCAAEDLIEHQGRITGVRVRSRGEVRQLSAKVFVLAAGALHSPRLLLRSTGLHPAGCANSSGWVGRGLMMHLNEMIALWPRRGNASPGATRSVSFRDLCTVNGNRLGLVQSMGLAADAGQIASFSKGMIRATPLRRIPGIGKVLTAGSRVAAAFFGNASVLVGLLEDVAYFENRVTSAADNPDMPVIDYRISDELRARRAIFRKAIRQKLRRHRMMLLCLTPTLNYGHPAGTLRFGNDPKTSVLDADCKAHDVENLFVADASFLPNSMGVNPSLTIAANALRVADKVADLLQTRQSKAE